MVNLHVRLSQALRTPIKPKPTRRPKRLSFGLKKKKEIKLH